MDRSAQLAFNPRLESLRGIAALGVVATHCFGAFKVGGLAAYWATPFSLQPPSAKALTILGSLLNPEGAVVLFFILSGYVLSLSFLRSKAGLSRQLGPYFVRRLLRLFPALWISIWFMAIVRHLLINKVPISAQTYFFYGTFHRWIDLSAVLTNCVLIDFHANPITWTMYVEVIGSLLIPLMLAIAQKDRWIGFGFMLILILEAWWTHAGLFDARNYLFCFQLGVLLACYSDIASKPQVARWGYALFGAGWALMFIERMASTYGLPGTLVLAAAAVMLLTAVVGAPTLSTFRWLDKRPIRFLGRISYSLYLLHLAVLYALAQALASLGLLPEFGGIFPILLLTVCTVGLSTLLAWLSYNAVELPFIRLGKEFGSGDRRRPPPANTG